MSEFAQKKGENGGAWVARLARVSTAGLSDYLLFVLNSWKGDAAGKAGGPEQAARPAESSPAEAGPPAAAGRGGAGPLEAAKRAAKALSGQGLARFTFWLTHGQAD